MRKLLLLSFLALLSGCEQRHESYSSSDKREGRSVGRFSVEVVAQTQLATTARFYDPEYGNVCYILDGNRSIDCVPANK